MKLLEALAAITQADLDDVNKQVADAEAQLQQLRELQKIIEIKLGVRKPPGAHLKGRRPARKNAEDPEEAKPESGSAMASNLTVTDQYRIEVKKYLMANGTSKLAKIARDCGIPNGSITAVVKHKWFTNTEAGIGLGPAAYQS